MFAVPAHTVELVLEYISPLTDPLPPHLTSTPLRQRHRLLDIAPSSPADYLCWPSAENTKVVELLDRLPARADHQASYPTRYTADAESTFAHVQISPGLCMTFHWDDAWKYHNLRLMPFPSPSFPTPQESLAVTSTTILPHPSLDLVDDDGDNDPYWDSYGTSGRDLFSPSLPRYASQSGPIAEDAYWAQYASVQGSADSTVPSPLPVDKKLRPVQDGIVGVPEDVVRPRSRLAPPSPITLAHLLNTISPRQAAFSPGHPDPPHSPSTPFTDPSPEETTEDSELVTPPLPDEYLDATIVSPMPVKIDRAPFSNCHPYRPDQTENRALSESIKGLYSLWRSKRNVESDESDRDLFLRIVREAVAHD